jgi:hypothetical protein
MRTIKSLLYLTIVLIIISCGGGGSDEPTPPPAVNKAPSVPSGLVSPTNGLLCIDNTVTFTWNSATDPEGDNITYEIVVAKDSQFNTIVQKETTASLSKTYTLEKGIAHYWRVKAVDAKGNSSDYTSAWGFYTEGAGTLYNYVPFSPTLIKPALNANTVTSVDFEWNATDLDNDPLTYDFYLSTSTTFTTPTVQNHGSKQLNRTGLIPNTNYYWRVDVKDTKGGKATGQVWSFKTSS